MGSHKVRAQPTKDAVKQQDITIHGFSEADQTELYTRAQSHKTTGRLGLGQGSAPKKIGGARWEGTKTRLDSDSECDDEPDTTPEEEALENSDDPFCDVLPGGVTIAWFNGVRPSWFLDRQRGSAGVETGVHALAETIDPLDETAIPEKKCKSAKPRKGDGKSKKRVPCVEAASLTEEQRILCFKAAKRALRKAESGELKQSIIQTKLFKALGIEASSRDALSDVLVDFIQSDPRLSVQDGSVRLATSP